MAKGEEIGTRPVTSSQQSQELKAFEAILRQYTHACHYSDRNFGEKGEPARREAALLYPQLIDNAVEVLTQSSDPSAAMEGISRALTKDTFMPYEGLYSKPHETFTGRLCIRLAERLKNAKKSAAIGR